MLFSNIETTSFLSFLALTVSKLEWNREKQEQNVIPIACLVIKCKRRLKKQKWRNFKNDNSGYNYTRNLGIHLIEAMEFPVLNSAKNNHAGVP